MKAQVLFFSEVSPFLRCARSAYAVCTYSTTFQRLLLVRFSLGFRSKDHLPFLWRPAACRRSSRRSSCKAGLALAGARKNVFVGVEVSPFQLKRQTKELEAKGKAS